MILCLIFGFLSGIGIGSVFHITLGFIFALSVLSIIFFLYRKFAEEKYKRFVTYGALILCGIFLGLLRIHFSDLNGTSQLASFVNEKISGQGIVVDEPDVREDNSKLTVKLSEVNGRKVSEKVLVTVPLYPEFHYGDLVSLNVKLLEPKNIESDGRVFNYVGYLRVRGIWYTANYGKVSLLSSGHGSVIKTALFKIKKAFTGAINNAIPEPESSLMGGLLLGTKQSLGKELLGEFSRAGVSHVVVLSGYNIAIVATSIMSLLKFLPATLSFGIGCVSIILFTIMSGGGASAVRAAIMVLVALFAKKMNRNYTASRAFGFAVILMLAPNPLLLVFDPSFQLSALATIGLIFVSPFVSPYLLWVSERFGLWLSRFSETAARTVRSTALGEIVSSTIATQLTVLPFLIYNTGVLSLVSLPVNILILGTIPITMFFGFVTGMVGLVSLWLSFVPALFSYVFLRYQLTIVHIGATLPFGAITLPAFSPAVLVLVYCVIFSGLYFLNKRSRGEPSDPRAPLVIPDKRKS